MRSFLAFSSSLLLSLLGSLVLGFLLRSLVLVSGLLFSCFLGSSNSLTFLDLSGSLISEGLLLLGPGVLELLDVIERDALNSSLLSEDLLLLVFANVSLL